MKTNFDQSLASIYHDNTCLLPETTGEFARAMHNISGEGHPRQYPANHCIPLGKRMPADSFFSHFKSNLWKIFSRRKSSTAFSGKQMGFDQLSQLLLPAMKPGLMREHGLRQRPYPSAGGLYAVNVYLLANNIENLQTGIYNINPDTACLEQRRLFESSMTCQQLLRESVVADRSIHQASAFLLFAGNRQLVESKYGDRGYRFLLLETGHIAQNISLAATALEITHVPLGGFCEHQLEQAIDDKDMTCLYVIAVG